MAALLGVLSLGCGDPTPSSGVSSTLFSATIQSVTVSPSTATIRVGEKITLTAVVTATPGAISSSSVLWSTSDPIIANVAGNGVVEANTPGTVTITAASAVIPTIAATAELKVVPR